MNVGSGLLLGHTVVSAGVNWDEKRVGGRQFILESLGLMKSTRQKHRLELEEGQGTKEIVGVCICLLASVTLRWERLQLT